MSVPPHDAEPASTWIEGSSLGPFRLVRRLGSGGFAPVWLAEEIHDGKRLRDVAVKLFALPSTLRPGAPEAERWRAGIIAEARALCRVEHPNVVRYLSLQRDDPGGQIGLVMELASGDSLSQRLDEGGRLPVREVIEAGIDVCWALAAVHAAGLVHRDVKPANIVRGARGHTLIDFGLVAPLAAARRGPVGLGAPRDLLPSSPSDATRELSERSSEGPVALAGTPGYIAPECLVYGGPSGSPSADLYALGVTLFKLVAGGRPDELGGAPTRPVTAGARFGPALRVEAVVADRSPELHALSDVIATLIVADAGARARHADRIARQLEKIRDELGSGARSTAPARGSGPGPAILALPVPGPLAPFFARAKAADPDADPASAARLFAELGLGILRYSVAAGLALLTADGAPPSPALVEALLEARPTSASWARLARALALQLAVALPVEAARFAFLAEEGLSEAIHGLAHEGSGGFGEALDRLGSSFAPASELLAIAALPAPPWLPILDGRPMLPEAPRGPGLPWRVTDPENGARHDAPSLDAAVRGLTGVDAEPPRSTALRRLPIVGRGAELAVLEQLASSALDGRVCFALITGPLGIGRTRLLDAAIARAGAEPSRVLRFGCSPERRGPLRPLVRALEALPGDGAFGQITDAVDRALAPGALGGSDGGIEGLEGVEDALLWASSDELLVVAADDVQWADAHTLGVLRLLVERAASGAPGKLLVVAAARDEPSPSAELRKLRSAARRGLRSGVKQLGLEPLGDADSARLARAAGPLEPAVEDAVVRGAGGIPFLIFHALAAWREAGALVLRGGVLAPAGALPLPDVPGVADLLEARLDACFEPSSAAGKAALRALAAVAIYGGGLRAEVLLALLGDGEIADEVLEALAGAGILTASGDGPEHGFAQEMVRQAALNLVRRRPWFGRLSRALLDALALRDGGASDAAFLAEGYEKLGATEPARRFRRLAFSAAADAGLFDEAAEHGDRLAALADSEGERSDAALAVLAALVKGRRFRDARRRLDLLSVTPRSVADVRRRVLALRVVHGLGEPSAGDPTLLADADALGDAALACEARLGLAGVAPAGRARELLDEAVERAQAAGPLLELTARVQRFDLAYGTDHCDLSLAERDLTRALALSLVPGVAPPWQQLHLQGSLVVVEAELGRLGDALARLRALIAEAEARGMRSYVRLYHLNLAAFLLRAGSHAEAAAVAERTHRFAEGAGDAQLQASALSIRAAALGPLGALDDALRCADEAERLQRERGDRLQALTLLRRASILEALNRPEDALRDARQALSIAERDRDADLVISARVWEQLHLLRSGRGDRAALSRAVVEAEVSGVLLRGFSRMVIQQAKALLASTRPG